MTPPMKTVYRNSIIMYALIGGAVGVAVAYGNRLERDIAAHTEDLLMKQETLNRQLKRVVNNGTVTS